MRSIANLEIHVAHSCNLACESCSHYSNQGHKGILALEEADQWMASWSKRVRPQRFNLLGGEPTIHPRLAEFVRLARRHWPDSHLRLVTNGFLLPRHPELPEALQQARATLCISVHHPGREYQAKFQPIRELVAQWIECHGIHAEFTDSAANWTRRYRGSGAEMEPFADGQPRKSWQICPAKHCTQLFEGALWKCSPLAYLKLQDAKYHLNEKWRPYLDYHPLLPTCGDAELEAFFDREDEPYCSMCSASPRHFQLPLPFPGAPKEPPRRTPLQLAVDWLLRLDRYQA